MILIVVNCGSNISENVLDIIRRWSVYKPRAVKEVVGYILFLIMFLSWQVFKQRAVCSTTFFLDVSLHFSLQSFKYMD
jgi:hypothetical protein